MTLSGKQSHRWVEEKFETALFNLRFFVLLDVEHRLVRFGERTLRATIPDGARNQFLTGTWNAMGVLLEAGNEIDRIAASPISEATEHDDDLYPCSQQGREGCR